MMKFFWRALRRGDRGFTLIELLIVVAIIAILAAVLIPNFLRSRGQSRVAATKGNMKNLGTALESYFIDVGRYPNASDTAGLDQLRQAQYIGALPLKPDRIAYGFTVQAGTFLDYVVCDNTTDVNVTLPTATTVWYYSPRGGLQSVPSSNTCPPYTP